MARKKIKKIWLMGKIRELLYDAPEDFEWSVNHELKKIANGKDLSGFKVTVGNRMPNMPKARSNRRCWPRTAAASPNVQRETEQMPAARPSRPSIRLMALVT